MSLSDPAPDPSLQAMSAGGEAGGWNSLGAEGESEKELSEGGDSPKSTSGDGEYQCGVVIDSDDENESGAAGATALPGHDAGGHETAQASGKPAAGGASKAAGPPEGALTQVAQGSDKKGNMTMASKMASKHDQEAGCFGRLLGCFGPCGKPEATPAEKSAPPPVQQKAGPVAASPKVEQQSDALLPPQSEKSAGKKCLVIDLDETLVHTSFQVSSTYDFTNKMLYKGHEYDIFVAKRPGCESFLTIAARKYELVIFTASVPEYANGVIDVIDPEGVVEHRLFRSECVHHNGEIFVKDLTKIGRPIEDIIILDNNPDAYLYQPQNAIPINSWYSDPTDEDLTYVQQILDKVAQEKSAVDALAEIDAKLQWHRCG